MSKKVIFFGSEKPILNLVKYDFYNKLINQESITIATREIYYKYPQLPNVITYESNWKTRDIHSVTLHLLMFNFIKNINKGLFYDLRSFLFGPYKIKSPKFFFTSLKYFIKACCSIKFTSILGNQKNSSDVINSLRRRGSIGIGDHNIFVRILKNNNVSKVITISNFRDPKLFDLASACKELCLELHVFVECWDNISTGYGVPNGVSHLYVWSNNQIHDFYKFNLGHEAVVKICGSYRRSYSDSHKISKFSETSTTTDADLRILYLEGYFYENLTYSIGKIVEAILPTYKKLGRTGKIKIVIRKYPLKRQSIDMSLNDVYEFKMAKDYDKFIEITTSQNTSLDKDFEQADLVLSELTTAGLESAFWGIPVVFIGSNSSIRFLDSMAGYNYSFSKPIKQYFDLINLSSKDDIKKLQSILELLFSTKSNFIERNSKLLLTPSDKDKFAMPFNSALWNRLIKL